MTPATISLIVALLPVIEKLVINGVAFLIKKDITPEELAAVLKASKEGFPDMELKA